MTHLEQYYAAMWVSDFWYTAWILDNKKLHYKARAIVTADRVLNMDMRKHK